MLLYLLNKFIKIFKKEVTTMSIYKSKMQEYLSQLREILFANGVSKDEARLIENELFKKMNDEAPPRIAVIGETGVGKSSTINALFNTNLPVHDFAACTQKVEKINATTANGDSITIIDFPGLGEGIMADERHWELYKKELPSVDVALWVLSAGDRAFGNMITALRKISDICSDKELSRLVFGINKAEHMSPEKWNIRTNMPEENHLNNLIGFQNTVLSAIREIIPEWNGKIETYSAHKRYNLDALLLAVLQTVPETRRWKVKQTSDVASWEELVDPEFLRLAKQINEEGERNC